MIFHKFIFFLETYYESFMNALLAISLRHMNSPPVPPA